MPDVNRRAVFRADCSILIGVGHVVRCAALAEALNREGWFCILVTTVSSIFLAEKYWKYKIITIDDHHAIDPFILKNSVKNSCDLLVVDHYKINFSYEKILRNWADKILVIDDIFDRAHDCDFLVDQTYLRGPGLYEQHVPAHCRILTGSQFCLLRSEFRLLRKLALKRKYTDEINSILVSFGATDPTNLTRPVLDIISKVLGSVTVNVVVGSSANNLQNVLSHSGKKNQFYSFHSHITNMADLMCHSDLVIGAAGGSVWERCCLGLPSIVIAAASNQRGNIDVLSSEKLACISSLSELPQNLAAFISDPTERREIARKSMLICDGLGAQRLVMHLSPNLTKQREMVILRPAKMNDLDLIYSWQLMQGTRIFSRNKEVPTYAEHCSWFTEKLNNLDVIIAIIECNSRPVGIIRLDPLNNNNRREVSININPEHHGKGIAKAALLQLARLVPEEPLEAFIMLENIASKRLFSAVGYNQINPNVYVYQPHLGI